MSVLNKYNLSNNKILEHVNFSVKQFVFMSSMLFLNYLEIQYEIIII